MFTIKAKNTKTLNDINKVFSTVLRKIEISHLSYEEVNMPIYQAIFTV